MPLKRHHKWVIGSFSSIIIIFMVISGILLFTLFARQEINYNSLRTETSDIKSKLTELTTNILQTKEELNSLGSQIGSIDEDIDLLKASASSDFSGIIEGAIKSVVTIRTNVGQGTGFIISDEGYIVTNAHVLADKEGRLALGIQAITYEQETFEVDFIGYDGDYDIALLKIGGDYDSLRFADSDDVQIGEKVIAIGNPLGLQFSVTEGIVSAVHRTGINKQEVYIQTDAALNPGNSGGPLINKEGRVIGINNFKVGSGESLGFALESNYIEEIINEISEEALNLILV